MSSENSRELIRFVSINVRRWSSQISYGVFRYNIYLASVAYFLDDTVRSRWVQFLNLLWEFQSVGLPNGILKQKKYCEFEQKIDSITESEQYVEYEGGNFDFLNVQQVIYETHNSDNFEM